MHAKGNPKLLIVEDNSVMRKTTHRVLKSKFPELNIKEAGDGREAFAQIHDYLPDLILMDINLPGENGLKLTRRILNLYPQVVIIVFTNFNLPEYRKAALENGAGFFLSKSQLHEDKLCTIVESILASAV